jgi:superfamily II DNA helicase RecQ
MFGLPKLRPGQANAIAALAEGRDHLVVMLSGAVKSAAYQIAAVARGGHPCCPSANRGREP